MLGPPFITSVGERCSAERQAATNGAEPQTVHSYCQTPLTTDEQEEAARTCDRELPTSFVDLILEHRPEVWLPPRERYSWVIKPCEQSQVRQAPGLRGGYGRHDPQPGRNHAWRKGTRV
jgi:hypothetical protein